MDRKFDGPVSKLDSLDWSVSTSGFNLVRLGSVNLGNDIHWSNLKHSERTGTTSVIGHRLRCVLSWTDDFPATAAPLPLFTLHTRPAALTDQNNSEQVNTDRVVLDFRCSCGADLKPACHNLKSWDLWAAVRRLMTSYGRNTELKLIHFISSVIGLTLFEPNYRT